MALDRVEGYLGKADQALGRVLAGVARLSGFILVGLAFLITIDVILREFRAAGVIGFAWNFVEEWARYMLVLIVFGVLGHTLMTAGHIDVPIVVRRLPRRVRDGLAVLTSLASMAMLLYMLHRGITWMQLAIERGIKSNTVMFTPMWIPYLFVTIGLGLFALALLLHTMQRTLVLVRGPRGEEEAVSIEETRRI